MNITLKNISSLHKMRNLADTDVPEIGAVKLFQGERFSYQVAVISPDAEFVSVKVLGDLKDYVKLYVVKDAVMDFPTYGEGDDNYLTKEPGIMPDILVPLEEQNGMIRRLDNTFSTLWVSVCIPENMKAGDYRFTLEFEKIFVRFNHGEEKQVAEKSLDITVMEGCVPKQSTLFTQWFHADCIASAHKAEIFSEYHWELIEKYIKMAAELGINLILTPVITPPLDTAQGTRRPCVQLTDIERKDGKYLFDFSKLGRWISICKKYGIEHFEICQLFSQWGIEYAPNIKVKENGKEEFMFGWHVKAQDASYKEFLQAFIPALIEHLKKEGVFENCYFHISDEPQAVHLENYSYAYNLLKPLIGNAKTMDALSRVEFYEKGLVDCPVCAINHIEPFVEKNPKHLWGYHCCSQWNNVSNRFLSMPLARTRIIGLQIYKYNLEGFLQWGYNFYFSQYSLYEINPYETTSADGAFPSGDAFSVYPGKEGPLPSIRAVVFQEAMQDVEICKMLEAKIGREKTIELIEQEANMKLTFEAYPQDTHFLPNLMQKMKEKILEK